MEATTLQVLLKCNITSKYKGYTYLPVAVRLASQYMGEPLCIMTNIYPVVGQIFQASPRKVDQAIRKVIEQCWKNNRDYIVEIMGFRAKKCPGNAQFIDALVYYIFNRNTQFELKECV